MPPYSCKFFVTVLTLPHRCNPHPHPHTHAHAHTEQCKEMKLVKSDRKKLWITNLLYETWPNKYDIKNIFYLKFIILITNSDYCWKIKVKRVQALI